MWSSILVSNPVLRFPLPFGGNMISLGKMVPPGPTFPLTFPGQLHYTSASLLWLFHSPPPSQTQEKRNIPETLLSATTYVQAGFYIVLSLPLYTCPPNTPEQVRREREREITDVYCVSTVCRAWIHLDTFKFTYKLVWRYFDSHFPMTELKLRRGWWLSQR